MTQHFYNQSNKVFNYATILQPVQQSVQWHNNPTTSPTKCSMTQHSYNQSSEMFHDTISPMKCSMTQQSNKALNDTTLLQPVQQSVQWHNTPTTSPTKCPMTQHSYNQSNKVSNDTTLLQPVQQSVQWHNNPTTSPMMCSMTQQSVQWHNIPTTTDKSTEVFHDPTVQQSIKNTHKTSPIFLEATWCSTSLPTTV